MRRLKSFVSLILIGVFLLSLSTPAFSFSKFYGWYWSTANNYEGWNAYNIGYGGVGNGAFGVYLNGQSDPQYLSPYIGLNSGSWPMLYITYRNHTQRTDGKLYYKVSGMPWDETHSRSFTMINDGQWRTAALRLYEAPDYYGSNRTIESIRVDPPPGASGYFYLDKVFFDVWSKDAPHSPYTGAIAREYGWNGAYMINIYPKAKEVKFTQAEADNINQYYWSIPRLAYTLDITDKGQTYLGSTGPNGYRAVGFRAPKFDADDDTPKDGHREETEVTEEAATVISGRVYNFEPDFYNISSRAHHYLAVTSQMSFWAYDPNEGQWEWDTYPYPAGVWFDENTRIYYDADVPGKYAQ